MAGASGPQTGGKGVGVDPTREIDLTPVGTPGIGQLGEVVLPRLLGVQPWLSLGLIRGLHGDEVFSAEAVRRMFEDLEATRLRGTATALLCANPLALLDLTRDTPLDMLDLNRVFRDKRDGTSSQQSAHASRGVFERRCN